MQRRHKLHCGHEQNMYWSFFNMKSEPKTLLCVCVCAQLRRSWSVWTWRGLFCAGRVWVCQTWTVTKSLGGSQAAAWQESWSSPAHRRSELGPHTNTRSPAAWSVQRKPDKKTHTHTNIYIFLCKYHRETETRKVRDTVCDGDEDRKWVDGPSWDEGRGKSDSRRQTASEARWRETQRHKGVLLKDTNSLPLEKRLSLKIKTKQNKLFRWLIYFL